MNIDHSKFFSVAILSAMLMGCGASSNGNPTPVSVVVVPDLNPVTISNVSVDHGNFDPAPTRDDNGQIWMSYSHVSSATSGINQIETRVATTTDAGLSWQDAGVVNAVSSLGIAEINAIAHEVSRLMYNPFAVAAGADPWILLWHRYLSVLSGTQTVRLFEHGWIGMKSGPDALNLGSERKLFSALAYDPVNNTDALGAPEYALDTLYPSALGDCVAVSEPGILIKSSGVYVSLLCAKATPPGKIFLLRCDHALDNCQYLGDFLTGDEASHLNSAYDGYSASEMVTVANSDYLIVTPTISTGDLYRGCVAYKITDLDNASVLRDSGTPVAELILEQHGDFNGACGYTEGLSGSGIIMSEAFINSSPTFRLFTTGANL